MEAEKKQRGGKRPGAGRPTGTRKNLISVRISDEANEILSSVNNKSEFINDLIIDSQQQERASPKP